ncbi:MAG TPA: flagellar motor protein MotB [Solirubrobacteraceae bacterium]|jgi:chemotaxis protein MotB
MSRSRGRGRRRGGGDHEESGERWLLTYADMITLLMALFMVLFSISSVNISKVQSLQESLRAAFSGDILPGGKAIAHPGATANSSHAPTATDIQAIVPLTPQSVKSVEQTNTSHSAASQNVAAAQQEQSNFVHLKQQLDSYAARHGFANSVHTTIEKRGLVIRVLTDSLLYSSGSATLDAQGDPLLSEVADLLNVDQVHPIAVEGNTDNVPIHGTFPSNWELSAARASGVVRYLIAKGVDPERLTAVGYASLHPIASNSTPQGRALNRRVEIVLQRIY